MTLEFHQILDRDGNAVQRPEAMPGADRLVGGFRRQLGFGGMNLHKGVKPGLQRRDLP